jgi:lycopene cyclase
MDQRPVIIIGGNLIGSLLALRLKELHPKRKVKIVDTVPFPQITCSKSFQVSDLTSLASEWILPLCSFKWENHRVAFKSFEKKFTGIYATLMGPSLQSYLRKSLHQDSFQQVPSVHLEELMEAADFVIDTRPDPLQKVRCFRKTMSVMVELREPHEQWFPSSMETRVHQKDLFRYLKLLPVDTHTLFVSDVRFSNRPGMDVNLAEDELLWEIRKRWRIQNVIHREAEQLKVPKGLPRPWNQGRVIQFANLNNSVTGEDFANLVNLIDGLSRTSFRLGEVKEVMRAFQQQRHSHTLLSKALRRALFQGDSTSKRLQLLESIYQLPAPKIDKFLQGNLSVTDIFSTFVGHPLPVTQSLRFFLPL